MFASRNVAFSRLSDYFPRLDRIPIGLHSALNEADEIAGIFLDTFKSVGFDHIENILIRAAVVNQNDVIQGIAYNRYRTGKFTVESPFDSDIIHVQRMIDRIYYYF